MPGHHRVELRLATRREPASPLDPVVAGVSAFPRPHELSTDHRDPSLVTTRLIRGAALAVRIVVCPVASPLAARPTGRRRPLRSTSPRREVDTREAHAGAFDAAARGRRGAGVLGITTSLGAGEFVASGGAAWHTRPRRARRLAEKADQHRRALSSEARNPVGQPRNVRGERTPRLER